MTIIGSSYDLCEMALDKMQMFTWLKEHGYNCAKSYVDKEAFYKDLDAGEISFPVFVSLSVAVHRLLSIRLRIKRRWIFFGRMMTI